MSKEIKIKSGNMSIVKIANLRVRYIPVLTPIDIWAAGAKNSFDMMSIVTSPHVELMTIFRDHGVDWDRITRSRYFDERRHRHRLGMLRWVDEYIRHHIKIRHDVFKSIKKHGYKLKKCREDPVVVLSTPFWKSRFGRSDIWLNGFEIWNGAGRCSAAYVLGITKISVCMAVDKYPGTAYKGKFESKLRNIKGCFDGIDNNTAV